MPAEAQAVSWELLTSSRLLSRGPCELLFAYLIPSAATTDSYLYDGVNTSGHKITPLVAASATGTPFKPPVPIYCRYGLYLAVGSNVTGVFVMWRELPT